jgi:hypothetical protein
MVRSEAIAFVVISMTCRGPLKHKVRFETKSVFQAVAL